MHINASGLPIMLELQDPLLPPSRQVLFMIIMLVASNYTDGTGADKGQSTICKSCVPFFPRPVIGRSGKVSFVGVV